MDRDDTLCPDVPYCSDPKKICVFPDVPGAVKRLNDAGYLVLVATNQSGIGRGYFGLKELFSVNLELISQIEKGGGKITDVFFCPHRPDENCNCRKPLPGMGIQAIAKYGLDPSECWMIGDKEKDAEFGKNLGMRSILVSPGFSFGRAVGEILAEDGTRSMENTMENKQC